MVAANLGLLMILEKGYVLPYHILLTRNTISKIFRLHRTHAPKLLRAENGDSQQRVQATLPTKDEAEISVQMRPAANP